MQPALSSASLSQACQGDHEDPAPAVAEQPLLPAKQLSLVRLGQGHLFRYNLSEEQQPGPSIRSLPPPLRPDQAQVSILPTTSSAQLPRPPPVVPRTTAYRRKKAAEAAAAGGGRSQAAEEAAPAFSVQQVWTAQKTGQGKHKDWQCVLVCHFFGEECGGMEDGNKGLNGCIRTWQPFELGVLTIMWEILGQPIHFYLI